MVENQTQNNWIVREDEEQFQWNMWILKSVTYRSGVAKTYLIDSCFMQTPITLLYVIHISRWRHKCKIIDETNREQSN